VLLSHGGPGLSYEYLDKLSAKLGSGYQTAASAEVLAVAGADCTQLGRLRKFLCLSPIPNMNHG